MINLYGHDYFFSVDCEKAVNRLQAELDTLKAENKRLREQQFRPANKCITPGCCAWIDTDYCTQCREDWAS